MVSQSTSPSWQLVVHTKFGMEYLLDPQTQLIIRVWSSSTEHPDPDKDQMVGFAAVDLSPLLSFPLLSGWYNILNWMDYGQLKVTPDCATSRRGCSVPGGLGHPAAAEAAGGLDEGCSN